MESMNTFSKDREKSVGIWRRGSEASLSLDNGRNTTTVKPIKDILG
jgi:hypothetical protein